MATYGGRKTGSLISRALDERTYLSTNVQTGDVVTYDPNIYVPDASKSGSPVTAFPYFASNTYDGLIPASVNSPFYDRYVYVVDAVITTTFDAGPISIEDSFFMGLWNGYDRTDLVTGISISQPTAIVLAGITVGSVFSRYEEKQITISLAATPPPIIDCDITISFASGTVAVVTFMGFLIARFYIGRHNWSSPVMINRSFLTSVFAGKTAAQSRKILRPIPSRTMSSTLLFHTKDSAARAVSLLRESAQQQAAYPWYPDEAPMTASNTLSRVYCPTEYRRFQSGGVAVLVSDNVRTGAVSYEIVRIDEVFADGFSTLFDIDGTFGPGDAAYPAFVCYPQSGGVEYSIETDHVGEIAVESVEAYSASILELENTGFAPETRQGLPVMPFEADFSANPSQSFSCIGGNEASGRGFTSYTSASSYLTQTLTTVSKTKQECWDTVGFFNYIKGRGRMFWAVDLLDTLDIIGTSSNISFTVTDPNDLIDLASYLLYVKVTDSNGDYDILEVESITGTTEKVCSIQANSLADIASVRQAHKVRMAEDSIEEEYLTSSVMLATFSVEELQGV